MDKLPQALLSDLQSCIELSAEVVALNYTSDSVTVHYKHGADILQESGDYAILTLPYPVLRFVDVLKSFSPGKQIAIRQLNYLNAIKVFIECRRRFWEEDEGIFGGTTTTDLPIQQIVYPEHGRETGRGVLIGCYTYDSLAAHLPSLSRANRQCYMLI
jgi:monoamine oxidase